jgi:hypothetical protein
MRHSRVVEWKSTALKRLKETYKSDDVVIPGLQRHVMRQAAKEDVERSPHVIHPSEMVKPEWCGRHDFYRITDTPADKKSGNNPSFNMENAFAEGHTIHNKYQTWLWEMGVLYGEWKCERCSHRWSALSPLVCPLCESPWLHYMEVTLTRPPYLISGHADGAVHDLDGFTGLIEVKSIGIGTIRFEAPRMHQRYLDGNETLDEMWWKINRPFPSHMKQGQLYLWLSWPKYSQIVFIYESKFPQKQKEFLISYNPRLIAPLIDQAKDVSQGVRAGIAPERPVWAVDMQVKTCRSCIYRKTCWSINEPDEEAPAAKVRVKRADPRKRRAALSPT